jgi:hypothetical protein
MLRPAILAAAVIVSLSRADVILDDFDNHFGDPGHQSHVAAAKVEAASTPMGSAGGYWYMYQDADGSNVTDQGGVSVTPLTAASLVGNDGILHATLSTAGSTNQYPYAGVGVPMVGSGDTSFVNLSGLTGVTIRMRANITGALRLRVETNDYATAGFDWGYYGYDLENDASPGYSVISIPVAQLIPAKYSDARAEGWTFDHGATEVNKVSFQVKDGATAEIHVDYIILQGVDYTAFGFTHADDPAWPAESVETGLVLPGGAVRAHTLQFNPDANVFSFTMDRTRIVSLTLYSSSGGLIKTLFSGRASTGQHSISWNRSEGSRVKSGVYICRLQDSVHEEAIRALLK